jgi:hypothetical protein
VFIFEDNEDFQVEILDQIMSSSNSVMEKGVRFVNDNIEFLEIPNLFTLSEVMYDMLLQTLREKNPVIQSWELVLGRVNSKLPFVCVERKLTTIDYEQMMMEAQHIVDKK